MFCCAEKSEGNPLDIALSSQDYRIKRVMDSLERYELQIRFTQIDRRNDSIIFTDFDFQVDPDQYFYPASTVKFPTVVAALEKLNQTDSINLDTKFYIEGDSTETTFRRAIQEIFAISDNQANNRLIEFLGFDELNNRLQERGINSMRIAHRLSTPDADNVTTKPLVIYTNDSTTVVTQPIVSSEAIPLEIQGLLKGKGFYEDDSLYLKPFDFSLKNFYALPAQHKLLKRIIFPDNFKPEEQFKLSKKQYNLLLDAMSCLPRKAGYDETEYYDSYGKFFIYGDSKETIPDHVKIYNKVGYAYGTLTDCAYVKDTKNNIDFMLTATILVNNDGIFNDNHYEYDKIGIPFLAQLGRELYNLELRRKR